MVEAPREGCGEWAPEPQAEQFPHGRLTQ